MNERNQQNIKEYLQRSDVQARIWQDIQDARSKATVTISRAASLFNFSESQLREWEKRGLVQTERSLLSQDGKGSTGHRQYSPTELDKLAIIRELIKYGSYAPGDIPVDVDQLWMQIAPNQEEPALKPGVAPRQADRLPIDSRVRAIDKQKSWSYFVSQAVRISLMLICEDIRDTVAGLILPLESRNLARSLRESSFDKLVGKPGPSLVGWLGKNRSFYMFLTDEPGFEYPTDFRVQALVPVERRTAEADTVLDNILIVVQRNARPLSLSPDLIQAVKRLLNLVYERVETWQPSFESGMRDLLYQTPDLERASRVAGDIIFNSLLERIIDLGGKTSDNRDRWSFCALLLSADVNLPLQQQVLTVRAQTRNSPYEIGVTSVNPADPDPIFKDNLSLKAFQSGQTVYFAKTLPGQSMISFQLPRVLPSAFSRGNKVDPSALDAKNLPEKSTHSALAVPIGGEYGISSAVLYIAAEYMQAFTESDQRVVRMVSRMIEELLLTSQARRQVVGKVGNIVNYPSVVDETFQGFASETDFMDELDFLLSNIQKGGTIDAESEENVSIISIDIDNQSSMAMTYGNRMARNVSQQMGFRIRGQMQLSDRYAAGKLFHRVTTHLGVASYSLQKLEELLGRYPTDVATNMVRALIVAGTEEILNRGKSEGGDRIITWDIGPGGGWEIGEIGEIEALH